MHDRRNYKKAFLACRKHRIDFAIFIEHDSQALLENVPFFVEQIDDVDFLNLFLTSIGSVSALLHIKCEVLTSFSSQSALATDTITTYCDAIREALEKRDLTRYVNSILTAYVVKRPADYEASLSLLLRLRGLSSAISWK